MGSQDFHQFVKAAIAWPENEVEARQFLTVLREHLGCESVVLRIAQDDARGMEIVEPKLPTPELSDKLVAWIRARFDSEVFLQKISLPQDQPAKQYHVVPLANARQRGWLAAGGPQRAGLSEAQRLELIAAAMRLDFLAEQSELKKQLQSRSQFLSIASHELKTPLTSIYGLLQLQQRMVQKQASPPLGTGAAAIPVEKQLDFFRVVLKQCERINELIDGLLDVSRIQNGRFSVDPIRSEVVALIRETVSQRLERVAQEAGVSFQLELPATWDAWVDPVRFEEVVTNLGMNAIRFSPEGGVVWIKLQGHPDQGFSLSFRDQGPQIPEMDRLRIFQPFEKAQRTSRLGGLGLGLFISRQIAQLHGGEVKLVESLPGKGNLIVAEFPGRAAQAVPVSA